MSIFLVKSRLPLENGSRGEIKSTHPPSRRISSMSVDFIGVSRFIPPVIGVPRCELVSNGGSRRVDLVEKSSSFDEDFSGGEGEIRTLATVSRPTPLAGAPLHRLEYFSVCSWLFGCDAGWRREWDSNPRPAKRVTGFQDQLLKPLGHLSIT